MPLLLSGSVTSQPSEHDASGAASAYHSPFCPPDLLLLPIVMNVFAWSIFICLLAAVAVLAIRDEKLDAQAEQWLAHSSPMVRAQDNGYFALVGLFAAAEDDSHQIGRQRVKAYELALASNPGTEALVFDDYPDVTRLEASGDLEFLCKVEQASCLSHYAEQSGSILATVDRHRVLLNRYYAMYGYPAFVATATPGSDEPLIALDLLSSLNRLNHSSIGVEFSIGSRLKATESLSRDLRFVRFLLTEADQLILKMAAVEMLARDLRLFAQLLDSKGFLHAHLPVFDEELGALDLTQRSVDSALRREFQSVARLLLKLNRSTLSVESGLPDWIMGVFYKPIASVNRAFPRFQRIVRLSRMDGRDFARELKRDTPEESLTITYLSNPVGAILADTVMPDMQRYVAVLQDCVGLLRLVKLKQMIRQEKIQADEVAEFLDTHRATLGSPYEDGAMHWDERRQVIEFEGLSDKPHLQELPVLFL